MKTTSKYILSILSVTILAFNSCQNVLDVMPDGRKTLEDIFASEPTAQAYLNGCYQNFPQYASKNYFNTNTRIATSDDAWEYAVVASGATTRLYTGSITPTEAQNVFIKDQSTGSDYSSINKWDLFWRNIRRCNVFLENIDKTPVAIEEYRQRWIAEAKVLRSYYFMELIACFGNLPIPQGSYPLGYDYSSMKKNSFYECAKFVINDCKDVIDNSILPWRIEVQSEKGRMTKAIAAVLASRAALYAASPLWNDGANHWAEAEQITKEMLEKTLTNGYELYTSMRNPTLFENNAYREYFCQVQDFSSDPFDKETILSSKFANATWTNIAGMPILNAHKAGLCPTQELVDAYCMKANGLPVLDLKQPYEDMDRHLKPRYYDLPTGYDPENPYVGRDPRFEATVYYNGSKRKNAQSQTVTVETHDTGNCNIETNNTRRTPTGYYQKKYDHPNSIPGKYLSVKYPIMRLAELYLNYAEAAAENGSITAAVNNGIKPLRDRVNVPNIQPRNQEEAILMIRNERRVELAFEENRHYDLRRWETPDGDLEEETGYLTGMWIVKNNENNTLKYMRFNIGDSYNKNTDSWANTATHRACASNKFLLWPIETSEVNRLETATGDRWQNPGW